MTGRHAHLIGIYGTGMRSLADFLLDEGWHVTGSDVSDNRVLEDHFHSRGVTVQQTESLANLPGSVTNVVYTLAIDYHQPGLLNQLNREIPRQHYAEFLGDLSRTHQSVVVAGTHGKTTTCLLLDHLVNSQERTASLICGGRAMGRQHWGVGGPFEKLIIEGCEFRRSFHQLTPQIAVLLGIEADHFDCYPDRATLREAFRKFCLRVPRNGCLIANADCELTREVVQDLSCRVLLYSSQPLRTADTSNKNLKSIEHMEFQPSGSRFTISGFDQQPYTFELGLCGTHQVANATAAILAAREMGASWEQLQCRLPMFPGVERRFQVRSHTSGIPFVDDYAHHPSEIRASLQACLQKFPGRERCVIFQPHQILRTESLFDEFVDALLIAEHVILLPIFAAREAEDQRIREVSERLVSAGNCRGGRFEFYVSLDQLRSKLEYSFLECHSKPESVILTLGAGSIDRIYDELSGFFC